MPRYDYKCKNCAYLFEISHKMTESPQIKCPKCQNEAYKTIAANVGIAFKGAGFYVTDSKQKTSVPKDPTKKPKQTAEAEKNTTKNSKNSKNSSSTSEKKNSKVA